MNALTNLDAVLAANSVFPTVAALVADMVATGYRPTFRADVDVRLVEVARVVADATGVHPFIYVATRGGTVTVQTVGAAEALLREEAAAVAAERASDVQLARLRSFIAKGLVSSSKRSIDAVLKADHVAEMRTVQGRRHVYTLYKLVGKRDGVYQLYTRPLSAARAKKTGKILRFE